ncbi:hypothetical protein MMC22_007780 [Lobaria immixta]|nr:hypothetical protein [Lobaria immixta]
MNEESPQFSTFEFENVSSRPQTTPRPEIKWSAISLLQRGIPNLFDQSNRTKTIQSAKRKHSFVAGLKKEEAFPAPKRRGTKRGFSPEVDHLVQTQPDRSGNGQVGIESQPGPEIPEDTIGEVDYRRIRPTTRREIRDVRDALLSTRLDFRRKTGLEPPETPEDECYAVKHHLIQNAMREVWLLGSEPPNLRGLDSWTSGFNNWHKLKNPDNSSDALFADFKQLVPGLGLP